METLRLEVYDGVAVVRLDRPPVNAVNRLMMSELKSCFDDLADDRSIGAVVLSGAGDRAFCAGIDLKERASGEADPDEGDLRAMLDPGLAWRDAQHAVRHCALPVIAAVDGPAIGAGLGLVAMSDIIVASKQATFGLTEINVGLLGGASMAMHLVGPWMARRMLFTGELMSAETLHRTGGCEELVPPGQAEEGACALAAILATKSPLALRLAKASMLRIEGDEMGSRYRTEQDYTNRLRGFNDSQEAMEAYLEKRQPKWTWS